MRPPAQDGEQDRYASMTAAPAHDAGRRPAVLPAISAAHLLPLLALALAVLASLFIGLGTVPLFDVDEGAFSEATREMLARGDYVSTWLNGAPRFDKPILTYWLQAASVTLFGMDEFALRLPSALAATAWIAAIGVFARARVDGADGPGTGYAAAFIAATTAGVSVIGRGAIADALLNLFLALAMFDIMRYATDGQAAQRRRVFLWIGLGLLTKGPVALLVPGAASCLGFAAQGRLAAWWRALRDPLGWAILLAVAAPWYLLEYARRGDAFLAGFFMRHNVERFMAPLQGHGGGILYYLPALLLVLLPWCGLLLATVPAMFRATLPALRRRRMASDDAFLWSWFLFVFAFFSLAGTKLPHYLLYGVTPLFILMARARRAPRPAWLVLTPPLLMLAAVAALPYALERLVPGIGNAYVCEALGRSEVFGSAWRVLAWLLLGAALGLAVWRGAALWLRLAATSLLCTGALGGLLLPAAGELQQGPVKEAAQLARRAGWDVQRWRIDVPSFSVYRAAVTPSTSAPRAGQVILTRSDALHTPALAGAHILYRKGGIVLLRVHN
ncbi:glycosyltransferase family 39 protein [Massilia phyllosphaerae]|uniref:glycosyltransferase family 39 protein n=1 Tax=Massilia phyllosphaerae TaxID=3106034 RepID=UPI002B1CCE15|nr:glycosyltransferase family 39 protein [Massilia sp. SGZ-792]